MYCFDIAYEVKRVQELFFGFRFSVFGFRFSVFGFRFSVFGVRCSVFSGAKATVSGKAKRKTPIPTSALQIPHSPLRIPHSKLLPFDRRGGFGADVVTDAVDARDLIDDPCRHLGQYIVGQA